MSPRLPIGVATKYTLPGSTPLLLETPPVAATLIIVDGVALVLSENDLTVVGIGIRSWILDKIPSFAEQMELSGRLNEGEKAWLRRASNETNMQ